MPQTLFFNESDPSFVAGAEALCAAHDAQRDLSLCCVCLQWTCDGPECHRAEVCDDASSAANVTAAVAAG